jgi:phosphate/sulfate permease
VSFARLRAVDWLAFVAALALLFFMALDWYTTKVGEADRAVQHHLQRLPRTDEGDQAQLAQEAGQAAESHERNAWQQSGGIDRVALIVMLVTVGLAVAAGFFRAANRRFEPPWTPSAYAAIAAMVGTLLVAYRIIQQPGLDQTTDLKLGAPLALAALAAVALASARALRNEDRGEAFRELPPPAPAGAGEQTAETPPPA